jgi:hypothetical protein
VSNADPTTTLDVLGAVSPLLAADVVVGCERVLYRFITSAEFAQYLAERGLQGRV